MARLLVLALLAGVCAADVIDFTDSSVFGGINQTPPTNTFAYTTADGHSGVLTSTPFYTYLTQSSVSGVGIGPIQEDEIQLLERLWVNFTGSEYVGSFTVAKLYGGTDRDKGYYSIDGGANWIEFSNWNSNGITTVAVGANLTSIGFKAGGATILNPHDYSVMSIQVASVPEGSAAAVLGLAGATVLGWMRRRRRP